MSKELQLIQMKMLPSLIKRIDNYREQAGFTSRTQAMMHLMQRGLESEAEAFKNSPEGWGMHDKTEK